MSHTTQEAANILAGESDNLNHYTIQEALNILADAAGGVGGAGFIPASEKGQPDGVATLGPDGKVPSSQIDVSGIQYKGTWDASTNTPALADGAGTTGDLYKVAVAGTQDLGSGSISFAVGDHVLYDGVAWDKIEASDAVPANPSATVGLTAKNGSASTYMRSDAAPALDPSIFSQTSAPGKLLQFDNGYGFTLDNGSNGRTEYSPAAIFMYGPGGNWIDIDASSMEIDLLGANGNIHIGQDGIDTGDKPITTSHTAAQPNELINKALLDSAVAGVVKIVASDGKNAQSANVNSPTFYAVPQSGMYRVSAFLVVTRAATTSSTLPSCSVSYTEATSGQAVQDIVTLTANTNLVGLHAGGTVVINAQQGSNIGYVTSNYASAGATSMQYSVHLKIEYLGL